MSDDFPNWIDDQLRQVRLPDGLLERLRQVGAISDDQIDQVLAEVPLPPDLQERLLAIVDDEQLDDEVREVATPAALIENLLFIPYEERLTDVPLPDELLPQLRRIPPRRRRKIPASQLALAASLLVMIVAGYLLSLTGMVLTAYDPRAPETEVELPWEQPQIDLISPVDDFAAPPITVAEWTPPKFADVSVTEHDVLEDGVSVLPISHGVERWLGPKHRLTDSILPIKYGLLGYLSDTADHTPALEVLNGLSPRGIEPPIVPGFDRQHLITKRTHPVVRLEAVDQRLASLPESQRAELLKALCDTHLPLWTRTSSFDRARRLADRGRLPAAHEVHVEDFVAAMDYHYPPVEGADLGLRVYAGPSQFGESGAYLMQVGVQAGEVSQSRDPQHIVFVLDYSQSMTWGDRWEVVCEGILQTMRHLQDDDRVSLVVFNDVADTLLEQTPADDREAIRLVLDGLSPRGATNVGAALPEAALVALGSSQTKQRDCHIILVSDGAPVVSNDVAQTMHSLLGEIADGGADVRVVDVGSSPAGDAGLAQIAELAGGQPLVVDSVEDMVVGLTKSLTNRSPVIATQASLKVSFNPKAVRAYRLLGHEATTLGGMQTASMTSTLTAEQSATAVYEVWLNADDESHVADVEVTWKKPGRERQRVRSQQVRRVQFKPSFRESPLQLQAAAVAVEAAEVLRESPFAGGRGRDLGDVLELAREVNPRLADWPSFQRYVRDLANMDAARK